MMYRTYHLICWLCLCCLLGSAQECPLPLVLTSDTVLCGPGSLPLSVDFPDADLLSLRWEPAALLNDPTDQTPTAQLNESTTFQLRIRHLLPTNFLTNGDFRQGDVGFTSELMPSDTTNAQLPLTLGASYWITDNPGGESPNFTTCGNTRLERDSVFLFRTEAVPTNVWCQTVFIAPQTDYQLSFESTTVLGDLDLQVQINGAVALTATSTADPNCTWTRRSAEWTNTTETSAEICFQSTSAVEAALDNIAFQRICTTADSVQVEVADLRADFQLPTSFCAADTIITLDSLLLPTASSGGSWTFDGQARFAINPSAFTPDFYSIAYTVEQGPCSARDDALLLISPAPEAGTPRPAQSICPNTTNSYFLPLLLSGQDDGGSWSTNDSLLAANLDPLSGQLQLGGIPSGTYTFFYSVSGAGDCPGDRTAVQLIINEEIEVELDSALLLSCTEPIRQLSGSVIDNPNYRYQWVLDGTAIADANQRTFTVTSPGVYRVEVTDVASGCTTLEEVLVTSEVAELTTFVTKTDEGCLDGTPGSIRVDSVLGGTAPYLYQLNGGAFQPSTLFEALEAGQYQLISQDLLGCEDTTELTIVDPGDFELDLTADGNPIIGLGESIRLRVATDLRAGEIDSLVWTPTPPNCDGCQEALVAPSEITEYFVRLQNSAGCSRTDSVTVFIFIGRIVYIPNAFSPNNDGLNDFLSVFAGTGVMSVDYLRIYDRYGSMIYEQLDVPLNDLTSGWDGRHQNGRRVPSDTYVYQAQIRLFDGRPVELKGEVYLMR